MEGLIREVGNFPMYATKICRKFNQERFYAEHHTQQCIHIDSTMLPEDDFIVFGFIDGSITETLTVGTGPVGDYTCAMRKEDSEMLQRTISFGY